MALLDSAALHVSIRMLAAQNERWLWVLYIVPFLVWNHPQNMHVSIYAAEYGRLGTCH